MAKKARSNVVNPNYQPSAHRRGVGGSMRLDILPRKRLLTEDIAGVIAETLQPWRFLDIEIGDAKQPGFFPQHKMKYWNNEVNVAPRLLVPGDGLALVTTQGNLTEWRKGSVRVTWELFGRSLERKIYLASKPENNQLEFSLNSKGVTFAYQPEFTAQFILTEAALGWTHYRPDHVVGSYVLFHATKSHCGIPVNKYEKLQEYLGKADITGADITPDVADQFQICNYATGRIDTWLCPTVIDSNGTTYKCQQVISDDQTRLTYLLPEEAAYPVVID